MTMTTRKLVDEYYVFRRYADPDAIEAFLFLVSEVGELSDAIRKSVQDISPDDANFMEIVSEIGRRADEMVSDRKGWVRNNGRAGKLDLEGEFGDVLMMLDRTARAMSLPDVGRLLLAKVMAKGFVYDYGDNS